MNKNLILGLAAALLLSTAISAYFAGAAHAGSRALHYMGDDTEAISDVPGTRFLIWDDADIDNSIAILFGIASGFIAMTLCGIYIVRRQNEDVAD